MSSLDWSTTSVETHISSVFFAGDRAYKLLKPIRTGFLDHSDVDRRIESIRREHDLNRRLAPDVYLGVDDLHEHGRLTDRLLVMRRLPDDRRLSTLVDDPGFADHLRRIAHTIAAFHASLPPVEHRYPMSTAAGLAALWSSSFEDIEPSVGTVVDADEFERVHDLALGYLHHSEPLFRRRHRAGLVRDGHGDLIAEDIFVLDDGPRILDCLAFDDNYRISDVLADIAFLVMDIERLAGPHAARKLMSWYCEFSAERHPASLAHHFVAYRAHVRAKVALLRHRQGDPLAAEIARLHHAQALDHLDRARRRVVLVGGGPGCGKTTTANALADRLNWSVIDSDTLRKDLSGIEHGDHDVAAHPDLYSASTTEDTYRQLLEHAEMLLLNGESVVMDATWCDPAHRHAVRSMAARHGAVVTEFECRLDPRIARRRIADRNDRGDDASDATPELVEWMSPDPWPEAHPLDTTRPQGDVVADAVVRLFGAKGVPATFATVV